jgi:hypothetical protein
VVQVKPAKHVALTSQEAGVPGLELMLDFLSSEEERSVLAAVDARPWECLAKRRVQHYGTRFEYLVGAQGPGLPLVMSAPLWHSRQSFGGFQQIRRALTLRGPGGQWWGTAWQWVAGTAGQWVQCSSA